MLNGDRVRRAMRRGGFEVLRRLGPAVAVDDRGMRFYFDRDDRTIGYATYRDGIFDFESMEYALGLLARAGFDLRGRGFIDVGANVGTSSVPALCWFGASRLLAFEPSHLNVRHLRVNLAANDVAERATVVRAAVSSQRGELDLELAGDGNHGDHRLRAHGTAPGRLGEERRRTEPVPVVVLDDYRDAIEDAAVLWVDTQGHEGHVLAGGADFAGVPAVIEFWPYALERCGGVDELAGIVADRYSAVVDVGASIRSGRPVHVPPTVDSLRDLAARYLGPDRHTDLALIP